MVWLVLAYMFHTIGELCQSPVAMSFITKLAPAKYVSIMMGFYFAATGLGNKVAGLLGESASEFGEFTILNLKTDIDKEDLKSANLSFNKKKKAQL